jgi:hypothetical protein
VSVWGWQGTKRGEMPVLTFVITMIILLALSGLVLLAVARGEGKGFDN